MTENQPVDLSRAVWRKSSLSNGNGGACVEVADNLSGVVAVRDSKDPQGPVLVFSTVDWRAFTAGIRNGEFDGLT
ncbi:DUF397 domain-containing protein [Planomonospora parontospora]|uniref:DUF397 domain-containing protein n=1 Tax=Planomonospora parontospora TaxID=58119 RepID=UPI0019AC2804|nr:DUF397 domain-containing protein [Planomonospora parontospora]GGL32838.1 hypothetical protein GCM10014719_37570 [Planomonospora parontospora subsp. antibiotica]GII17019.1 hypothetical protein Ppa05_37450 [Planomonospora parontospora subsp. antibiotica]